VGGVLANSLAAFAVGASGGWRAAFVWPGILLGIGGLSLAIILPNSRPGDTSVKQQDQKRKSTSFVEMVMSPGVLNLAVSYLLIK